MNTTQLLIIGGGIALVFLIVGLVVSSREERKLVENRLGKYIDENGNLSAATAPKAERSTVFAEQLTAMATRFSWGQVIARDLARADLKLKVAEYIAVLVMSMTFVGFLAWWFGGRNLFVAAIGFFGGYFLPGFYVNRQKNARLEKFDQQLGDMLNLMVNGLRAGYSTMQALEAVSRELPAPISDEFRRVVQEMQLGISMEKSLDNLFRRIPSPDLDLIITAMNVQREVGGNLSEILDTISHTIRERVRLKGEIRVLTSQVMMSGKFLAVMPIFLSLGLYFLNRDYMMNFFNPDLPVPLLGIGMLGMGAILIAVGYFVMMKIADIEI